MFICLPHTIRYQITLKTIKQVSEVANPVFISNLTKCCQWCSNAVYIVLHLLQLIYKIYNTISTNQVMQFYMSDMGQMAACIVSGWQWVRGKCGENTQCSACSRISSSPHTQCSACSRISSSPRCSALSQVNRKLSKRSNKAWLSLGPSRADDLGWHLLPAEGPVRGRSHLQTRLWKHRRRTTITKKTMITIFANKFASCWFSIYLDPSFLYAPALAGVVNIERSGEITQTTEAGGQHGHPGQPLHPAPAAIINNKLVSGADYRGVSSGYWLVGWTDGKIWFIACYRFSKGHDSTPRHWECSLRKIVPSNTIN